MIPSSSFPPVQGRTRDLLNYDRNRAQTWRFVPIFKVFYMVTHFFHSILIFLLIYTYHHMYRLLSGVTLDCSNTSLENVYKHENLEFKLWDEPIKSVWYAPPLLRSIFLIVCPWDRLCSLVAKSTNNSASVLDRDLHFDHKQKYIVPVIIRTINGVRKTHLQVRSRKSIIMLNHNPVNYFLLDPIPLLFQITLAISRRPSSSPNFHRRHFYTIKSLQIPETLENRTLKKRR